jgi:hypothetical protein
MTRTCNPAILPFLVGYRRQSVSFKKALALMVRNRAPGFTFVCTTYHLLQPMLPQKEADQVLARRVVPFIMCTIPLAVMRGVCTRISETLEPAQAYRC